MINQNKKNYRQVLTTEYKKISFLTIVVLVIPIILGLTQLVDVIRFSKLGAIQQLLAIVGLTEFKHLDTHTLIIIYGIVGLIMIPTLPLITARLINGQKILDSVSGGLGDYGKKRTWNYILKVQIPTLVVCVVMYVLISTVPASMVDALITDLMKSMGLSISVLILLVIIVTLFMTIINIVLIANIVYMRGSDRIKVVFKSISSREINKLLIFNFINISFVAAVIVALVKVITVLPLKVMLQNIWSIVIVYMIFMMIAQVIFTYLRIGLYINIALNAPLTKGNKVQNSSSLELPTSSTLELPNESGIEVNEPSETVTDFTSENRELSIKPKRKAKLNSDNSPFNAKR